MKITNENTTYSNDSSEKNFAINITNNNNFTYVDPFFNIKKIKRPTDMDSRCFACRSKKCFQVIQLFSLFK